MCRSANLEKCVALIYRRLKNTIDKKPKTETKKERKSKRTYCNAFSICDNAKSFVTVDCYIVCITNIINTYTDVFHWCFRVAVSPEGASEIYRVLL
jgi:hypothetical protein